MKAVIVEMDGKYAVALSKNGDFIKVKKRNDYKVGKEVEISSTARINIKAISKIASVAAVFLFVTGLGYGVYSYNTPYSYLNIDINPSVELTTNIYNRIIKCKPLTEDGKELLELVSFQNKKLEDGVDEILKAAAEKGYFNDETKNAVMITVSGKDEKKVEEIENVVRDSAEKEVKKTSQSAEVVVQKVTLQRHDEAKKLGISPGKMTLIDKLKEVDPQVKADDYKDKPVKEIINAIKNKKKNGNEIKDDSKENENLKEKSTSEKGNRNSNGKEVNIRDKSNDKGNFGDKKTDNRVIKKKDKNERKNNTYNRNNSHGWNKGKSDSNNGEEWKRENNENKENDKNRKDDRD